MHGLIRQRTELRAQRRHHPSGQVEVTTLRAAEMLFDRDHFLLRDESVPAAQRLSVLPRVRVVGRHVAAHDARSVLGNVQTRLEAILNAHTRYRFSADSVPRSLARVYRTLGLRDIISIRHSLLRFD